MVILYAILCVEYLLWRDLILDREKIVIQDLVIAEQKVYIKWNGLQLNIDEWIADGMFDR